MSGYWLYKGMKGHGKGGGGTGLMGTSFYVVLMLPSPSANFWGLPPSPVGHYYPILQGRKLRFLKGKHLPQVTFKPLPLRAEL